jgi:AcrR family transcriptional regulator
METVRPSGQRRRRADGERTRLAILRAAADLATVEGLEGLSIGRLAAHIGISKSGLYAHFGSKQELQLATIELAGGIFEAEVVRPAAEAPPGRARVEAVCEAFLSHVERRIFAGGCFFAAAGADFDTRPGPVKQKLAEADRDFTDLLESFIGEAQERGELAPGVDREQLAFELTGLLGVANARFVMYDDATALDRARRGIKARLDG